MNVLTRARQLTRRWLGAMLAGIVLLTLAPLSAVPAQAASISEREPNNSQSTANVVNIGDTVTASSSGSGWSDSDYYAIDLPKPGRLALNLKFPSNLGAGDAYDVDVYNAAGTKLYHFDITGNRYNGSWLAAQGTFAPAGRLYVRDNWASWGKTYTLAGLRTLTATPTPTISGTAKVGKKLTAKPGTWKPAPVTLTYQWLRSGKAISGATKSTYKLVKADKGKKVSVKVTGSKSTYASVTKTSASKTVG